MHSLEPEFRRLHAEGVLDDAAAAESIARERGEVFSLHGELRLATWAAVLAVVGGVGVLVARHLDRLDAVAILVALVVAAVGCAVPAVRARTSGRALGVAADYALLLGALLASAALAYAETRFGLLGPLWPWHLLLLAAFHALVAYAFGSALVLAASLTALAGWFGVGLPVGGPLGVDRSTPELGARAIGAAAAIVAWRVADARLRPGTRFTETFDQIAANLAFWGALAWCLPDRWEPLGAVLLAALSAFAVRRGLARARESYVVYGVGYAAVGVLILVLPRVPDGTAMLLLALLVVGVAAAVLWDLQRRIRESRG